MFNMILQLIRRHPRVFRKDTKFRKCIQADKRLAMALIWLAHGIPFKVLGDMFGVGTSTACNVVHDTVHAMADILPRKFIKFPVKAALQKVHRHTLSSFLLSFERTFAVGLRWRCVSVA
jgi:hypothetical protein